MNVVKGDMEIVGVKSEEADDSLWQPVKGTAKRRRRRGVCSISSIS